jgi:acyl-CoA synthetase (AMP-forming)/AMP-acid ligase II
LLEKLGSIGVAIPGVSLTIRRDDGTECGTGEIGEIVASGPNIMQGYWNDPQETAKVLKSDGLHTGDLARRDEDGYIFIVDRIKNMIKSGAHRISAKEIEETIAELPGVAEACVVGVPDELLGEAIEAYVVPVPAARAGGAGAGRETAATAAGGGDLDAQAILRHCNANLAKFKIPRAIHFRDSLPKNSFGKVIKGELIRH